MGVLRNGYRGRDGFGNALLQKKVLTHQPVRKLHHSPSTKVQDQRQVLELIKVIGTGAASLL